MSPERRFRVLSFFFDGVPAPGAVVPTEPAERIAATRRKSAPRTPRIAPVLYRHEPDCDDCHEGDGDGQRLALPREELCWDCHDQEDFEGAFVHGPVAAGECVGCHNPHKSKFEYLLRSDRSAICARCHDPISFPEVAAHQIEKGGECLECHNPHASDLEYMLIEKARAP